MLRATGRDAARAFANEAGGHRWQRVPPTEKRGRVHTSTITVVVLEEPDERAVVVDPRDLVWKRTGAGGSGGQHVQKNETAVVLTHRPSGIRVRSEGQRSLVQNQQAALRILRAKLAAIEADTRRRKRNRARREMAGSGMRGDKRRTIAVQRGEVVDHRTGRSMSYRRYARGYLHEINVSRE